MQVRQWKTSDLRPYDANPRINDHAVEAVARSLKEFGFRQPIVASTTGTIVCGHTRWKAAKLLGLKKVPVHVAAELSPTQIKAYRLADNKTAELANWDSDSLVKELNELRDIDYDLGGLGFPETDLDALISPWEKAETTVPTSPPP